MKVLLIAGAHAIHSVRWANGLAERGHRVHIATLHYPVDSYHPSVKVHYLRGGIPLGYFSATPALQRLAAEVNPDIINVHYASGYGTLARLSGIKPLIISVWGSDVYDFPRRGPLHKWLLRKNLEHADSVCSTSRAMLSETFRWAELPHTFITPFGVDSERFQPKRRRLTDAETREITVGTIKGLSVQYGVDTLVFAFSRLRLRLIEDGQAEIANNLKLLIVGEGRQRKKLESLVANLGVADATEFRGGVSHDEVPHCLHELDVYVALSRSESFGVAILEASACGVPVVVSDADGPKEVVEDGTTGFVVPRNQPDAAADAIYRLVMDPRLRAQMGRAGREHVLSKYTWHESVNTMLDAYQHTIQRSAKGSSKETG